MDIPLIMLLLYPHLDPPTKDRIRTLSQTPWPSSIQPLPIFQPKQPQPQLFLGVQQRSPTIPSSSSKGYRSRFETISGINSPGEYDRFGCESVVCCETDGLCFGRRSGGRVEWDFHRQGFGFQGALARRRMHLFTKLEGANGGWLAIQVTAEGLDPRTTLVSQIMTPNPMVTRDTTSATQALQLMVEKHFRHLVSAERQDCKT